MDRNMYNIVLVFPIFIVLYGLMGLLLGLHKRTVPFGQRREGKAAQTIREFISTAGGSSVNQAILKIGGYRQRLDELLMRGGYPFGWKAGDFLFMKECMLLLAAIGVWQTDPQDPFAWLLALPFGFMLPDIFLRLRITERQAAMQRALPGLVDLLALALESGLDLMVAIERIGEKMVPGALRDELQALLQESRLGAPRREILQRWAFRTGLGDAQSLSSLIIQSEEMGTPLSNVLRNYAEDMRSRRILRAEEMAGKIPVKILFPMMVFFFPIVFVIILGPMAAEFLKSYK